MRDLVVPLFVLVLFIAGCNKDETVNESQREMAIAAAYDYLEADQTYHHLYQTMDKEAKQQGDLNGYKDQDTGAEIRGNCPEVSLTTNGQQIFPAKLVLDYGTGCTVEDELPASGAVAIEFTGLLLTAGTSISMSFDNFEYNHYKVGGNYSVSNDGKDANDQLTFSATLTDGMLTDPEGKTILHNFSRVQKWIEGQDTHFFTHGLDGIQDDAWAVTVNSSGVNKAGISYQITTLEDLRAEISCQWPVSGQLELHLVEPNLTSSIDFGDGTCDNKAWLTVGGITTEIEL